MNAIGIRREDHPAWERLAPLVPRDIVELVASDIGVVVQPSQARAFGDEAYAAAGAALREALDDCTVILGVEPPAPEAIAAGRAYLCFTHLFSNRAERFNAHLDRGTSLVRRVIAAQATLLDYALITGTEERELPFFGRQAGQAGTLEALATLGQKFMRQGVLTPLANLESPHHYRDLEHARAALSQAAEEIARVGLPEMLPPLTIAVHGEGNAVEGARHVLAQLPVEWVAPDALARLGHDLQASRHTLYAAAFEEQAVDARPDRYLPHTTMVLVAAPRESADLRHIDDEHLARLARHGSGRLQVVGDIGYGVDDPFASLLRTNAPAAPRYTFHPERGECSDGVAADGITFVAADALPAALPVDASRHLSQALRPFVPALAAANFTADSLERSGLPGMLQRACLVWRGVPTAHVVWHPGVSGG